MRITRKLVAGAVGLALAATIAGPAQAQWTTIAPTLPPASLTGLTTA